MAQIEVKVKLDLPAGVELLGYERCGEGHGFEVKFPLPLYCRYEKCGTKEPSKYEYKNYFDGRYTSAAVEGINNKARVITKRCYGVKSSDALCNRASEAVGRGIDELREIVGGLKAVFLAFCTRNRKSQGVEDDGISKPAR